MNKMGKINILNPENIRRSGNQKACAMCYLMDGGRVLMIKRKKEPFAGKLVAPGGKFESGENPFQCIEREIFEETGLRIKNYDLKIVTSEVGPENYNWILYLFICGDFTGSVIESSEGRLVWVERDMLRYQNMADIDRRMLPYVMDDGRYFMALDYDGSRNCSIAEIKNFDREYGMER